MKRSALTLIGFISVTHTFAQTSDPSESKLLDQEQQRIVLAQQALVAVAQKYQELQHQLLEVWHQCRTYAACKEVAKSYGQRLWRIASQDLQEANQLDDRSLYWARLQMTAFIVQTSPKSFSISLAERQKLAKTLDRASRGLHSIDFQDASSKTKRILISGFDPFFLDRNLGQSNPSGIIAMALDSQEVTYSGVQARIESVVMPVRFADFDEGIVEDWLNPYFKQKLTVDMVITVSMGRSNFDLEHFPGKRRSAQAPDNLNQLTGASSQNPIVPMLKGQPLSGPEFVVFSLPVAQMLTAPGSYKIEDNRWVTTLEKGRFEVNTMNDLQWQTSVEGSGGGYLSNEISYRSIRLRDLYQHEIPVGHIHTPVIQGYDSAASRKILNQVKRMLEQSLTHLK